MIKAILWDHTKFETVELDPDSETPIFKQVNEMLECRTMTSIAFNSDLEAYVDDEGLLIENPKYGAMWYKGDKLIQGVGGKILFVNHDENGKTISITNDQREMILGLDKKLLPNNNGTYQALILNYYEEKG